MELNIILGIITMGGIVALCLILSLKAHDRYLKNEALKEKEREGCCE